MLGIVTNTHRRTRPKRFITVIDSNPGDDFFSVGIISPFSITTFSV